MQTLCGPGVPGEPGCTLLASKPWSAGGGWGDPTAALGCQASRHFPIMVPRPQVGGWSAPARWCRLQDPLLCTVKAITAPSRGQAKGPLPAVPLRDRQSLWSGPARPETESRSFLGGRCRGRELTGHSGKCTGHKGAARRCRSVCTDLNSLHVSTHTHACTCIHVYV